MTPKIALEALRARGEAGKAREMAAYHKAPRTYLGVANPVIDDLVRSWRADANLEMLLSLASGLWASDVHEARIAAAKLLNRARFSPDDTPVWNLIVTWVPDFDAWAIADHASMAGQKRLVGNPDRLETVGGWTTSSQMWSRRAALVMTLPWARLPDPSAEEINVRERVLGWAARYVDDGDWFIQKSVAWWLRELSKKDPQRVRRFLAKHGSQMKAFARREAAKYLE